MSIKVERRGDRQVLVVLVEGLPIFEGILGGVDVRGADGKNRYEFVLSRMEVQSIGLEENPPPYGWTRLTVLVGPRYHRYHWDTQRSCWMPEAGGFSMEFPKRGFVRGEVPEGKNDIVEFIYLMR